jgi:serine/threonine-protein kinase
LTELSLKDHLQTALGSSYTIQRELGGGGMSKVFLARDESLGRDVVIKLLPRELAAEMSVERFAREIKLAAALQHPHVLPVLSAGAVDGLPYYTMPFVRGESLRGVIEKGGMSLDDSLGVLRDVAKALRYAHSEHVVHRDIKPENVLMSSGVAVVVDFGIAKALSASRTEAPGGTLTLVGTSMGTPAYMSPEQAAADPNIDHRADIYAWGVMAYELLSKKHMFAGKTTPQQFLAAHLAEMPQPLRKVAPEVPPGIAEVVMKALEKNPDARPQSADEILSALGNMTSGSQTMSSNARALWWKLPVFAALAIVLFGVGYSVYRNRANSSAASPVMLAVLPFENQGPPEQDYFVDGLTDAVNGKLAGLAGMNVIDRRSTASYKKTTKPVKQIGSELGVEYVLGGVVRWSKTSTGLRAQVLPTLVKTSDATTRWAGDPVVVSSDDPFSAQTEIATKVATALQVALGADERRDLAQRPTENTKAYDAFLRGKALFQANLRVATSVRVIDQAIAEFQRAVSLDPKFAQAWAYLSYAAYDRAREVAGDTASFSLTVRAARRAEQLDPDNPDVVIVRSGLAFFRGDKDRGITIITDALRRGIISPELLTTHAFDMFDTGKRDSANAVMAQAIKLNPRFVPTLLGAADLAEAQRDWSGLERYARAVIDVDPTDERGWAALGAMGRKRGDSAMIRSAVEQGFKYIPSPTNLLLVYMVYAGDEMGARFIKMTPEQVQIETLADSVGTYYDNKADYFLARHDLAKARIYHDSIIAKMRGRNLAGPGEPTYRIYLANALAFTGHLEDARRELNRATQAAIDSKQTRPDGTPDVNDRIVAAVRAHLGDYDGAIASLRRLLKDDSWTRAGMAREPKLQVLRGNPAYEAFLKEPEPSTGF